MIPMQYALRRRMMAGSSKKKTIKFTLGGTTISNIDLKLRGDYWAEDGMTWAEWCYSDYNPTNAVEGEGIYIGTDFKRISNRVLVKGYANVLTLEDSNYDTAVSGDDVIIADYVYGAYMD